MAVIDDLKKQLADLTGQLATAQGKVDYLKNQYAISHYGGQTPGQFAAILAPAQAAVDGLHTQIAQVQASITKQQVQAEATPDSLVAQGTLSGAFSGGVTPSPISAPSSSPARSGGLLLIAAAAAAAALFLL